MVVRVNIIFNYVCDESILKTKKGPIKYRSSFFPDQSHHIYFEDDNLVILSSHT